MPVKWQEDKMVKGLKVTVAAFYALAAMMISSCSNLNTSDDDLSVSSSGSNGRCAVKVSVTNFARMIAPEAWSKEQLKDLTFILKGSSSDDSIADEGIELTNLSSGSETVELSYGFWDLTLEAKNDDGVVLIGKTTADLSNGAQDVPFTLKSKGVTTPSSISISGTYDAEEDSIEKIEFSLLNQATGALISGTKQELEGEDIPADNSFTYSVDSVTPGTYLFQMNFYKMVNSKYKKIGNYGDLISIVSGKTTTANLSVNSINKKPTAPSNLNVKYNEDFEADGYYVVDLEWEDNSFNEDNFIITVYSYDSWDAETPTSVSLGVSGNQFVNSDMYESGSILAGNTTASLRLKYGKTYDFGIKAENCVGTSEEVMRSKVDDNDEYYNATRIARNLVTYDFAGCTLTPSGEDAPIDEEVFYQAYDYTGSAITITKNIGEIQKGGKTFDNAWKDIDGNAVTTLTGVGNITVYAKITENSGANFNWDDISIADYSFADLDASNVVIKVGNGEGSGSQQTVGDDTVTVNNNNVKMTIEVTAPDGVTFDSYALYIAGTKVVNDDTKLAVSKDIMAGKVIGKGPVSVIICAKDTDGKLYSCTKTITIQKK